MFAAFVAISSEFSRLGRIRTLGLHMTFYSDVLATEVVSDRIKHYLHRS